LDRMKAPSSRTSLEDNYNEPPRRKVYDDKPDRYVARNERSRRDADYDARSEGYDRRRDYDEKSERGGGRRDDERSERGSGRRDDGRSERGGSRREYDDRSEKSGRRRDDGSGRRSDYDDRDDRSKRRGPRSRTKEPPIEKYERDGSDRDDRPNDAPVEGHGYDIWGSITAVASKLTINVSQAWEKSIQAADGEITPAGQESRLTKALKAYHLAKARSPSDLPPWLFDEHERGGRSRSRAQSEPEHEDYEDRFNPDRYPEPPRPRGGFRDIYDSAPKTTRTPPKSSASETGAPSKATDRLRQIRDAKRSAVQTGTRSTSVDEPVREERTRTRAPPAPPRGLPSRPRAY